MSDNINPEKFFARGSKYVDRTLKIWDKRRYKLMNLWCTIYDLGISDDNQNKKLRIDSLIKTTNIRLNIICKFLNQKKEQIKKARIESDEMFVMLECPSFQCRYGPDAYGTGIRYKDYEPGKLKCDKCGMPLREQNHRGVDNFLIEAGINI